ncbi:MAG: Dabb family protein [Dehalococcoidales bacterium]|nr:Dabb family protein [Dehalococcoidales bacterium]
MPSISGAGIIRVAVFSFKTEVTETQKEESLRAAQVWEQVPGVLAVEQGPCLGDDPPYQYMRLIYYADTEARARLLAHPIHDRWAEITRPLTLKHTGFAIAVE